MLSTMKVSVSPVVVLLLILIVALQHFHDSTAATDVESRSKTKICALARCMEVSSKLCSRCRSVYYCSREHQREDWPTHKKKCMQPQVKPLPFATPAKFYQAVLDGRDYPALLEYIKDQRSNPFEAFKDGVTALMVLSEDGKADHVQAMMKHPKLSRARVNAMTTGPVYPGDAGYTGLSMVAQKASHPEHLVIIRELLKHGADVKFGEAAHGTNPFHFAVGKGHIDAARLLLEHNSELLNHRNNQGTTALMFACSIRVVSIPMVMFLLEQVGIDVRLLDNRGSSALDMAVESGSLAAVRALLEAAYPRVEGLVYSEFGVAIEKAQRAGRDDIVELLKDVCPSLGSVRFLQVEIWIISRGSLERRQRRSECSFNQ